VAHIGLVLALVAASPVVADVVLPPAIAASPWLKDLRKSMLRGRDLSDSQLQTLADAGEGLAAARYAKRLEARSDPAFLDDAAHYYSIAVYMGRDFAVPRLVAILGMPEAEFSPARLRNLRAVLDRAARRGDPIAAAGLAKLLIAGAPFGPDIHRARELMLAAAEAGDTKAALRLALDLIQGADGLPPDPGAAERALELAAANPDPGVQAMVLTLQRQLAGGEVLPAAAPASAFAETDVLGSPTGAFPPRPRTRPATLEGPTP
jgi:TPR repeat protein